MLIPHMRPLGVGTSAIMVRLDVDSCQRKCAVVPVFLVALETTPASTRSLVVHSMCAVMTPRPKSGSSLVSAMKAPTGACTIRRGSVAALLHFAPNCLQLTADLFVSPAKLVGRHAPSYADAVPFPLTMATAPCANHLLALLLTQCVTLA